MDWTRFALDGRNTQWVAVSIERTGPCNLHAGIVYRDASDNLHRLHFAWHRDLKAEPYTKVACAAPRLEHEEDAMWISTFCGKIAKHAPERRIPYNLKYDEDVAFDRDSGEYIFGPNSTGLGCATFVLAVFRSGLNPLVNFTDWPDADVEDRAIQSRFVITLLSSRDPDKRAQGNKLAVEGELGTKRVRPDHVAGACLEDKLPANHPECDRNGGHIVARVDEAQALEARTVIVNPQLRPSP